MLGLGKRCWAWWLMNWVWMGDRVFDVTVAPNLYGDIIS